MDEAGVLPGPAKGGGGGQSTLDYGAGIYIGARLKLASLFMQCCFESLEPFQEHLVIIAGPSHSVCIHAA